MAVKMMDQVKETAHAGHWAYMAASVNAAEGAFMALMKANHGAYAAASIIAAGGALMDIMTQKGKH
jgi:hypothetical protein